MNTILEGSSSSVEANSEGPTVIIGERINPTGRKRLAQALIAEDHGFVCELALSQVRAGAQVLDINVAALGVDEEQLLPRVVRQIAGVTGVPLCLDTLNTAALRAALEVVPGKPLVNSVSGEESSLGTVLPLVKDRGAAVIALTMDEAGIPQDAASRVRVAGKILERAARLGIQPADVLIDPLVMAAGADSNAGMVALQAINGIRREFGVSISLGASNVSFGLPDRHTLNQAFLAMAISQGANCVITDPAKLTGTIRAADLLRGRDEYAANYIASFRSARALSQ
jgi:5-methyltetrahydrofolate--homocysteine methyltransferase